MRCPEGSPCSCSRRQAGVSSCLTVPRQRREAVGLCLSTVAEDCGRRGRAHPAGGGSGVVGTLAVLTRGCAGRSWLWLVSSCVQVFSSVLPQDICVCFLSLSLPSPNLFLVLTHALAVAELRGSWTEPVLLHPVLRAGQCVARGSCLVLPSLLGGWQHPLPAQPGSPVGFGTSVAG